MSHVTNVNGQTFQREVLESKLPVVVDFYATWCPPCKHLVPILDRLATEFSGKIKFVKVNSDEEYQLSETYQVTGLPTVVLIDGGQTVGQFSGLPDESALRNELTKWVNSRANAA